MDWWHARPGAFSTDSEGFHGAYSIMTCCMAIEILSNSISRNELKGIAAPQFGDFVKVVVDVGRGIMAVGGDMHADEEACLLDDGSRQRDLWGINLYPDLPEDQWVEFDSMINVRPSEGNRARDVEDAAIRSSILTIVKRLVRE